MTFRGSVPVADDWRHFRFEVDDGLAVLTFNRPDRLNALTFEVYADLRDLLVELPRRDDVACLVITGEGRGFCSGGDVDAIIGELVGMPARQLLEFTHMTGAVVQRLREMPIPVVAAVNGTAAGAGAVIALAADLRVLSTEATFRFLFTHVGLSGGDMGAAYLLPRVVGLGRATEILLFGEAVHADTAAAIGLANQVVEPDAVLAAAVTLGRRLVEGPTLAYASTKSLLTQEQDMSLAAAIELEAVTQAHLMGTEDFAEFHAAFTEATAEVEGPMTEPVADAGHQAAHRPVNPEGMVPPRGYSHAIVAGAGRAVYLAGQVASDPAGDIVGQTLAEQFDMALGNVVAVLAASGAGPEHVVSLLIYTTDVGEYRETLPEMGAAYRRHFGLYYPAMALLGVAELVDARAKVEIVATAVVPEGVPGA